jgi:trigger factor
MIEDALETLIPELASNAIKQESLDVISTPKADVSSYEPLTIQVIVPIRPQIDLGNYSEYRLEPEVVSVTKKQIDEALESIRRDSGTWEPTESHINFDNMVTLKVQGTMDDKLIIDDQGIDYLVTPDSLNPMPGFAEQLIDLSRGESKEFSLAFPKDYPQTELAEKICSFVVAVDEIKERKLPEVDDNFAKSLDMDVIDVKSLKKQLKEDILKRNQSIADQKYQDEIVQALVGKSNLEIPPLLIDHEVEHIISEQAEAMQRQQLSMDDYLNSAGKTIQEIHDEVRPSALERITRTLVIDSFRETENIEITDEEIENEINNMLSTSNTESESLKNFFNNENGRASIGNMLMGRKTIDRLTSIAKGEHANNQVAPDEPTEDRVSDENKNYDNEIKE